MQNTKTWFNPVTPFKTTPQQDELNRIMNTAEIETVFQPILRISSHEPYAFEALSRGPENGPLHMPEALFSAAKAYGRTAELDTICRRKAIERFRDLGLPGKLSVNICPSSLVDPDFAHGSTMRCLKDFDLQPDDVILELTEQQMVAPDKLQAAALRYQKMGFGIALDDLGTGYSGLRLMAQLRPDYIKIDKFFITGVHHNEVLGDFVELFQTMASRINCLVIAEGIEDVKELEFVHRIGIAFGQGYLMGRPCRDPQPQVTSSLKKEQCFGFEKTTSSSSVSDRERIEVLPLSPTIACQHDDLASEMLRRFQNTPTLLAIPVLKEKQVIGILLRDEMLNAYSSVYSHSLYHHATAQSKMQSNPLVVQISDSIPQVSKLATQRSSKQVYCPLIVCDGLSYLGTISVRSLLESITNIQLEYALHSNPLSRLPGNSSIEAEVQSRLDRTAVFALLHFDLDNFKAYNDFYGYERGDKMILLVSDLLRKTRLVNEFIGHIGGDDFVMLVDGENWEGRIWDMLNLFQEQSAWLYDLSERENKCIESTDRAGEKKTFDLATLSVSALQCTPGHFSSHLQTAEVIAEIKHRAKKVRGNSLIVDRRIE